MNTFQITSAEFKSSNKLQKLIKSLSVLIARICTVRYFTRLLVSPNILHRTVTKRAGSPSTARRFYYLFHEYNYMKRMNEGGF